VSQTEAEDRPPVVHAAGAVLWRERAGRLEVALVHRPRYRDWSWPKGKLDPGELPVEAAAREVEEETGVAVVLGVPLPPMRYRTPDGSGKHVRYWAARAATDDDPSLAARQPVHRAPLTEIDDVVWVSIRTARDLLTRRSDRRQLTAVQDLWSAQHLDTRVLVLARHGRARRRSAWKSDDAARPLTPQGRAQADGLVSLLAAFGVHEVVSSPWERCLRTVTPYAERAGVEVRTVEALTEAAHKADPEAARAVGAEYLLRPRDAVVATHRPVLPALLGTIDGSTRRWTAGQLPERDPFLRTCEILVVHVTGQDEAARVVALEAHRPAGRA
jgi:8-oxo-dGTP pyrophosphatase MutT (NUDIX family)/broad specificity phosphatase PhoE